MPPRDQDAALVGYLSAREELRAQGVPVLADELALLGTFADLAELSRNRPLDEERHTELRVHSSKEHFHTFLQSLDVERGGLPEEFHQRLLRVLRHYGVEDLTRTPALEEAVFRIFLAQQRSAPEVALASAVLGRWIEEPSPTDELAVDARELLERLSRATQLRFPVVGDLARSVRFRWFDQPAVDAERAEVLGGVRDEIAALAADGGLPDRARRIEALAAIPEQIVRFLAERLEDGVPEREPMLEVLVRRHYREYDLHDLRTIENGRPFVVADYTLDDRPTRVVSTVGTVAELGDTSGALATGVAAQVAERHPGDGVVVDLYLHWPDAPESADEVSEALRPLVGALPFADEARRVSVAVCSGGSRPVGYYAFRPSEDGGVAEDDLTRGVHPMVGRRLNLWRLRNFDVTRIEAPEDVLLYECVARENPADRRLVALAAGPAAGGGPRRERLGHRPAARGARGGELPRGDPPGAGGPRGRGRPDGPEPRVGAGLAGRRDRRRGPDRAGQQDPAADRRRRDRGGARPGPGERLGRAPRAGGGALRRAARGGCGVLGGGAADRAAPPAGRLRVQGRARPAPRPGLPLRARGRADR